MFIVQATVAMTVNYEHNISIVQATSLHTELHMAVLVTFEMIPHLVLIDFHS